MSKSVENEKPSTKTHVPPKPIASPHPKPPGQWKCSQTGPGSFWLKPCPPPQLPSPVEWLQSRWVSRERRILALTVRLAIWWSCLFFEWFYILAVGVEMPHKLSIWFMLNSIVWEFGMATDNPTSAPCSLSPRISFHCFNQTSSNVPPSRLWSFVSIDCPFIPGLWNPAETVGSSETLSGRPNVRIVCVFFQIWERLKVQEKPTWSDNWALIFPLNPALREGG